MFSKEEIMTRVKEVETRYIGYPRVERVLREIERAHDYAIERATREPQCILITARPGCGKTTICDQYRERRGAPQFDSEYSPVLIASFPSDPRPKAILGKLLMRVGDPMPTKGTQEERMFRLLDRLTRMGVEIIIIDELQTVNYGEGKIVAASADMLKEIVNETGLPVVLLGLPNAIRVFSHNEQLSRRFSIRFDLKPFSIKSDAAMNELQTFLQLLGEATRLDASYLHRTETVKKVFYATDGVTHFIKRLVSRSTEIALYGDEDCITEDHLREAYELEIQTARPKKKNPFVGGINVDKLLRSEDPEQPAEEVDPSDGFGKRGRRKKS